MSTRINELTLCSSRIPSTACWTLVYSRKRVSIVGSSFDPTVDLARVDGHRATGRTTQAERWRPTWRNSCPAMKNRRAPSRVWKRGLAVMSKGRRARRGECSGGEAGHSRLSFVGWFGQVGRDIGPTIANKRTPVVMPGNIRIESSDTSWTLARRNADASQGQTAISP